MCVDTNTKAVQYTYSSMKCNGVTADVERNTDELTIQEPMTNYISSNSCSAGNETTVEAADTTTGSSLLSELTTHDSMTKDFSNNQRRTKMGSGTEYCSPTSKDFQSVFPSTAPSANFNGCGSAEPPGLTVILVLTLLRVWSTANHHADHENDPPPPVRSPTTPTEEEASSNSTTGGPDGSWDCCDTHLQHPSNCGGFSGNGSVFNFVDRFGPLLALFAGVAEDEGPKDVGYGLNHHTDAEARLKAWLGPVGSENFLREAVQPCTKESKGWTNYKQKGVDLWIVCFRDVLRSLLFEAWNPLVPRVQYKAYFSDRPTDTEEDDDAQLSRHTVMTILTLLLRAAETYFQLYDPESASSTTHSPVVTGTPGVSVATPAAVGGAAAAPDSSTANGSTVASTDGNSRSSAQQNAAQRNKGKDPSKLNAQARHKLRSPLAGSSTLLRIVRRQISQLEVKRIDGATEQLEFQLTNLRVTNFDISRCHARLKLVSARSVDRSDGLQSKQEESLDTDYEHEPSSSDFGPRDDQKTSGTAWTGAVASDHDNKIGRRASANEATVVDRLSTAAVYAMGNVGNIVNVPPAPSTSTFLSFATAAANFVVQSTTRNPSSITPSSSANPLPVNSAPSSGDPATFPYSATAKGSAQVPSVIRDEQWHELHTHSSNNSRRDGTAVPFSLPSELPLGSIGTGSRYAPLQSTDGVRTTNSIGAHGSSSSSRSDNNTSAAPAEALQIFAMPTPGFAFTASSPQLLAPSPKLRGYFPRLSSTPPNDRPDESTTSTLPRPAVDANSSAKIQKDHPAAVQRSATDGEQRRSSSSALFNLTSSMYNHPMPSGSNKLLENSYGPFSNSTPATPNSMGAVASTNSSTSGVHCKPLDMSLSRSGMYVQVPSSRTSRHVSTVTSPSSNETARSVPPRLGVRRGCYDEYISPQGSSRTRSGEDTSVTYSKIEHQQVKVPLHKTEVQQQQSPRPHYTCRKETGANSVGGGSVRVVAERDIAGGHHKIKSGSVSINKSKNGIWDDSAVPQYGNFESGTAAIRGHNMLHDQRNNIIHHTSAMYTDRPSGEHEAHATTNHHNANTTATSSSGNPRTERHTRPTTMPPPAHAWPHLQLLTTDLEICLSHSWEAELLPFARMRLEGSCSVEVRQVEIRILVLPNPIKGWTLEGCDVTVGQMSLHIRCDSSLSQLIVNVLSALFRHTLTSQIEAAIRDAISATLTRALYLWNVHFWKQLVKRVPQQLVESLLSFILDSIPRDGVCI
eukprot:Lankesteria_metandrocarpae@DN9191_c0_g1_i1.p1